MNKVMNIREKSKEEIKKDRKTMLKEERLKKGKKKEKREKKKILVKVKR